MSQSSECLVDIRGISPCIHLGVVSENFTIGADHHADPLSVECRCIGTGAVSKAYTAVCIAQKRKPKRELIGKGLVLLDGIKAYTQNDRVLLIERFARVAEPATLSRSTRCVRFWIKPQNHRLTSQRTERNLIAIVVLGTEVRSGIAGVEHESSP